MLSFPVTDGMKFLPRGAEEKVEVITVSVVVNNEVRWDATASALPVRCLIFSVHKCSASLTPLSAQDVILRSASMAWPKRFLGTQLKNFSCLLPLELMGASFDFWRALSRLVSHPCSQPSIFLGPRASMQLSHQMRWPFYSSSGCPAMRSEDQFYTRSK